MTKEEFEKVNCKNINVNEKAEISPLSHEMVFTNIKASQIQLDTLFMLLAEIGKDTDNPNERNYMLTADQFMKLKHYSSLKDARKTMKESVLGDEKKGTKLTHIDVTIRNDAYDYVRVVNWFSWAEYRDGALRFCLTPEVKKALVEMKENDDYKIFASLKYLLPMNSQYSKQIYLMCKNYVTSGKMYAMNFDEFCNTLGIGEGYSLSKIKTRILDKAKEEINLLSDITIDYNIEEISYRGGKRAESISFTITKKNKKVIKENMSEMAKRMEMLNKKNSEKKKTVHKTTTSNNQSTNKTANNFHNFNQRDYDFDKIEREWLKESYSS